MLKLITRRVQMAARPQVKSMSSCELNDQVAAAAEGLLLCLLIKVHSTYFDLFAFGLFRLVLAYSLSQTTIESIEIS